MNTLASILNILRGILRGTRAFTVQPYTEANVKNGMQFYARRTFAGAPITGISGGGFTSASNLRYVYISVGDTPVIFKDRSAQYIGEEFKVSFYVSPGTPAALGGSIMMSNYRIDGGAQASKVAMNEVLTASITTKGTLLSDPEHFFGSTSQGQRVSNLILEGREFILPANTTFLVEIEMTQGSSGRFEYFFDWYEGGTDLPRKQL